MTERKLSNLFCLRMHTAPRTIPLLIASILLFAGLVSTTACTRAQSPQSAEADAERLREALEPFTGHWKGPFVAYTYDGRRVDSLIAEHRYRWEGDVQRGTFVDRYPDGRVIRAQARNYVREGQLVCEVEKEDGSRTVHTGTVADNAIVWHRRTDDGVIESFRERVVQTPDGREYHIDGFGVYPSGDSTTYLLFKGRYEEVSGGN
jgi:hypothetical protein